MPGPHIRSLHRCRRWWSNDSPSRQPATPSDRVDAKLKEPNARHQYVRARDLPKLIGLWPWEIEDQTLAGHARLLELLRRALRVERQRGLAGHWTYDLARHASLLKAYQCELSSFREGLARAGAIERPSLSGPLALWSRSGFSSKPPPKTRTVPAVDACRLRV
jgi:hypothetical protein